MGHTSQGRGTTRDRGEQQPGRKLFIPSASFMVRVHDRPGAEPRFRMPGRDGWRGPPELHVSRSTSRERLLSLLARGELGMKWTRN